MIHPEVAALTEQADRYAMRRARVRKAVGTGLVVIPGHELLWRNADNPFPFRQSSHLLYLAPIRRPGVTLAMDADSGEDVLYGPPDDPGDLVWHGPSPSLAEEAARTGITAVRDIAELPDLLRGAEADGRQIHLTPQFVPAVERRLAEALGVSTSDLDRRASEPLVQILGELRLRKSDSEIGEIETALTVTAEMFAAAGRALGPDIPEAVVHAAMTHVAYAQGLEFSFAPIVTVRGEVLHNHSHSNTMGGGDLLLIDAGLETRNGYASDVTRTMPVGGRFSNQQREIYEIVLSAHEAAIEAMRPGVNFRDVHDLASLVIARGLVDVGLMRGDPAEAVDQGAHALFFVHGLGHPLGLDVHDLHDLGDDVAYPPERPRSEQFGTGFLRFGRNLDARMVMTVEPGIYFIPALIDEWRAEKRFEAFIDYDAVNVYRRFGGIRIEDDVLVTETGTRILGPHIPRSVEDVEDALDATDR